MNTWGLIAIGAGLILGLFTRMAAIAGSGLEYSLPSEGNYLVVSKTLIEAVALLTLVVFPTGTVIGMDILVSRFAKTIIKKKKEHIGEGK